MNKECFHLGLHFALPLQDLPVKEVIVNTEDTARKLDARTAQLLHERVKRSPEQYKLPTKPIIASPFLIVISDLKKDDSIIIVPADKGNFAVVMDKQEYYNKIKYLMKEDNYRQIRKDPTLKLERTTHATLTQYEKKGEIDTRLSYHLQLRPAEN